MEASSYLDIIFEYLPTQKIVGWAFMFCVVGKHWGTMEVMNRACKAFSVLLTLNLFLVLRERY